MKRSEMIAMLDRFFLEHPDTTEVMDTFKLSKEVLFLIETIGMAPPQNLKKYSPTYNNREWDKE